MYDERLVLDTCALLWLASGNKRIPAEVLDTVEKASIVFVSAISAWEVSLKAARQQLRLPMTPANWFRRVIAHHNLVLAPLDIEVLTAANTLPWHHKDPADRFIIATALREKAAVVTADRRFDPYDVTVLRC